MKLSEWSELHNTAADACERLQSELSEKYPEAGLTFGYIGNVYAQDDLDDRGWKFFTDLPHIIDGFYNKRPSFPEWGVDSQFLPNLAERASQELEPWLRRQLGLTPNQ